MRTYTCERVFPGIAREEVWALWSRTEGWPLWDSELDFVRLEGAFQAGGHILLKPKGASAVRLEITEATPGWSFTDVARFPLALMEDVHELEDRPEGLLIRSVIRVSGPLAWLWDRLVARNVAAGVPGQMDALTRLAAAERA